MQPCFFRGGKFYKLLPELGTIEINGVRMHQTARLTPTQDAEKRARLAGVRSGQNVLDVCTGLGYSAIAAAERGARVTSVEVDENVLELAKQNPLSKKLFENPRIKIIVGNALQEVNEFDDGEFDAVLHDPPRFSFAGELYSLAFYKQLFRVLKKGGKLFHYTGKPREKRGKGIRAGVARRLAEAGFKKIEWNEETLGFTAVK